MENFKMSDRFEITELRGEKFQNCDEWDDSEIDSLSDCPEVMELFRFFHNCDCDS